MISGNDAAGALPDLVEAIAEIGRMQTEFPGWLTGLYLSDSDARLINKLLTEEDPIENSLGRYMRVPVFRSNDFVLNNDEYYGDFSGIRFTYHKVDHLG